MSTISIIGCGWLGFPLAKRLIQEGHSIKGSTTRSERFLEFENAGIKPFLLKAKNGTWEGTDISNLLQCDILIISIPPGTRKNPDSLHAVEIESLMLLIQKEMYPIKKIIFTSTTSVYKSTNSIVDEDSVKHEDDAGNKIVYQAERHILSSEIPERLVLRLGGLTGYERILARFFAGKEELAGGNEPVNLVHRDDVISSIVFLLNAKKVSGTINVCSPIHPTKRDFYTFLCAKFELMPPRFPEKLDGEWKQISSDKLTQLGYKWIFENPLDFTYSS
ncbi:nucleoside-diphosphate sugar epimerase [uncultured Cytophaga sp.]|uniref:nucleoside-diphosphate sugar epimerase n=1 Tax=uncultured Cytophaga sp. TaxID=160238 RepID=UPI002623C6FB|nr:nucleoside-diphosphate sugar epimerase [uncultured Cytophaga sp.]